MHNLTHMPLLSFQDLTHGITYTRPARWVITDLTSLTEYCAADAVHGAALLGKLAGKKVTEDMFYSLRSGKGISAGALRHTYSIARQSRS
jgi:hypothetical protein